MSDGVLVGVLPRGDAERALGSLPARWVAGFARRLVVDTSAVIAGVAARCRVAVVRGVVLIFGLVFLAVSAAERETEGDRLADERGRQSQACRKRDRQRLSGHRQGDRARTDRGDDGLDGQRVGARRADVVLLVIIELPVVAD